MCPILWRVARSEDGRPPSFAGRAVSQRTSVGQGRAVAGEREWVFVQTNGWMHRKRQKFRDFVRANDCPHRKRRRFRKSVWANDCLHRKRQGGEGHPPFFGGGLMRGAAGQPEIRGGAGDVPGGGDGNGTFGVHKRGSIWKAGRKGLSLGRRSVRGRVRGFSRAKSERPSPKQR